MAGKIKIVGEASPMAKPDNAQEEHGAGSDCSRTTMVTRFWRKNDAWPVGAIAALAAQGGLNIRSVARMVDHWLPQPRCPWHPDCFPSGKNAPHSQAGWRHAGNAADGKSMTTFRVLLVSGGANALRLNAIFLRQHRSPRTTSTVVSSTAGHIAKDKS